MPDLRELARPEILALTPYATAMRREAVWLDANECWEDPAGEGRGRNRYPESYVNIGARLAGRYGVDARQILLTRGSDDAIYILTLVFCRPGVDAVQVAPPTFHMYSLSARIQGAAVIATPRNLPDFECDVRRVVDEWLPPVKLVYLCSPNNPTGNEASVDDIRFLCRALAGKSLVVVDEAYGEFSSRMSAAGLLDEYPNVVVLRTLSKAWALAAERVGVLLARAEVIELVRRVLPPYPLAASSLEAALSTLQPDAQRAMQTRVSQLAAERERLSRALAALPGVRWVYPSAANFLLVRFVLADSVQQALLAAGVRVRAFDDEVLTQCLRITVGSRAENDQALAALHSLEDACA